MEHTLIYFHDPMCSWCYAFQPVWRDIQSDLPDTVSVLRIVGGLAPDDDAPMEESLREQIQEHWQRIQQVVPGIQFNFDFWTECEPRRSTYPACRAVIAAGKQGPEYEELMIHAIQKAYYREGRNPSDYSTHIELSTELGIDVEVFQQDLVSEGINDELMRQIQFTSQVGVRSFPSLVLQIDGTYHPVQHDYTNTASTLATINSLLS